MVQTEQQYICIHQCLMAVLEGKENTGPPREIHDNQGYEGKAFSSYSLAFCLLLQNLQIVSHPNLNSNIVQMVIVFYL